ncbi:pirin family protein [Oceaniserpentilla sp. 4NH20-0058]|uniref:pirin family protein n=1 Tax=Oceaniserpentilla sp. 4NH20-0058 TaxID=3127660 RepID=UPI0031035AE7
MRTLQTLLNPQDAMDGAGVKIKRHSILRHALADPFLMLDEILSDDPDDFIAGFPPHPHRGIETLTYMKLGGIRHEDHMGNTGQVLSGGAQWMKAGKGVIHGEMPLKEHNKMHGFQLWINLNSKNKMSDPDYRDVPKTEIQHVETDDYHAHIMAGKWHLNNTDIVGPLDKLEASAGILDLEIKPHGVFNHDIPQGHHLVVMVYEGEINTGDQIIKRPQMGLFSDSGELQLRSSNGGKVLVLHGKPHKESIANYGPFVMNTHEEIEQAIQDYQNGVLA